MFKKKPQIKNLSPLRSSDRRKLADQIIQDFHVDIPQQPETSALDSEEPVANLSAIRNSLLPEDCSSARFTTHTGADNKLVSGTVYIGSHPGFEERILWIQWGANDQRLFPTVYTLWQNPGLVPLLHTPGLVMKKLMTGADLMTPGLSGNPPWPAGATKNSIVAVAKTESETVPEWVGVCEIDITQLGPVQGVKGKAVDGIHWFGDEIWNWSPVSQGQAGSQNGGRAAPERLEGWRQQLTDETAIPTEDLSAESGEVNREEQNHKQASRSLPFRPAPTQQKLTHQSDEGQMQEEAEVDLEPSTKEVDDAFQEAFIYAVYSAKKNGSPPYYGLDLPGIQPSYLVDKMIQPYLRFQNTHYTIKKTSWKNTKKFIKHLDKQKLVKSKDRNGGETIILDIDFEDAQIEQFVPYALPKPKAETSGHNTTDSTSTTPPSQNQNLTLLHLYRASSKLVPDLILSKTDYYTRAQISDFIRTYIDINPELTSTATSKRFIKLNPFLANNILGSNPNTSDARTLAAGEIARDALQKRILDDDHLCVPFWLLLTDTHPAWDPSDRSQKPKAGAPPKVNITIEKRTGTKTVTTVTGLEHFHLSPQALGPELQRRCASSASVQQANGLKPGMLEIMVQGDQREAVIGEVGRRGVKREWVEVVDKTTKKKGGGR